MQGDGIRVSVCDEREELFPEDAAQAGLDVMRGIDKPTAIQMLLRAMSPQAIFCDEIGDMRDVRAFWTRRDAALDWQPARTPVCLTMCCTARF
ncbi:MAG: hypothetical protein ACLR4A_05520 [Christensenellales bacterium]